MNMISSEFYHILFHYLYLISAVFVTNVIGNSFIYFVGNEVWTKNRQEIESNIEKIIKYKKKNKQRQYKDSSCPVALRSSRCWDKTLCTNRYTVCWTKVGKLLISLSPLLYNTLLYWSHWRIFSDFPACHRRIKTNQETLINAPNVSKEIIKLKRNTICENEMLNMLIFCWNLSMH